ncbi:MAG: SPFH domain-containing protein [Planctomycetota bacterium]|jgi:regulator of protease activity HflC (stomatin/prohibitin superfamily)
MTVSSKRPEHVALVSLILSVVFFGIAFFLGRWSGFFAITAVSWLSLSAALIWFVLVIQFHQRALAEQEKLDMGQLARDEQASTIFQAKGERAALLAVAQRRLQILEKWFIPIFSVLIAVYQIGIGLYLLKAAQAWADLSKAAPGAEVELKPPLLCAVCMMAIAFVSFLISRYATGMSAQPQWKPLRAGGSFLLGIAVLCFALAIGLALAQFEINIVVVVINFVVPILLVVLGVETALNVVLDIYRPRLKGRYGRSAFDSRLLGIINEPGGILRSAADAIDYQFGFKVSQTWFYKLLEKAIVPLVLFAGVTLYLLSCVVVIAPDEEAIIEHFGNPVDQTGNVRHVKPGLTFKWPWPIDIAYKYPTKKVAELSIGFVPKSDPESREPLLWGKAHHEAEHHLLVASEQTGSTSQTGAVPVSLVVAAVPVQYRIKDLYSFIYYHSEPEKLLESICYRELTQFAASARIEVDDEADMAHNLLGAGRNQAKRVLTNNIQKAAGEAKLGVEIVFLGLQGVHPPAEVAADYQKVISAVQQKQALILRAQAERNMTLSTLVGSVEEADELYNLAARYQQAEEADKPALGRQLDAAFAKAKGDIFKALRESQSYAFERATLARATGRRFASQLKAYKAAEEIYIREQILTAFEESLEKVRKYIVVADPNDRQVIIIDFTEELTPSLYDLGGFEESSEK